MLIIPETPTFPPPEKKPDHQPRWYNLNRTIAPGSKLHCYYHVNTITNVFQAYPTLAIKAKL